MCPTRFFHSPTAIPSHTGIPITTMEIESHPLKPFLPSNAHTLFLGSFPPPHARWSMEFFYPNWINDFWRIMGLLFYGDRQYFESGPDSPKTFDRERIIAFCRTEGLAFFDTALRVRRLKANASDNFLEIVEPTDVGSLLAHMPQCTRIVTTGGKASDELQNTLSSAAGCEVKQPEIGDFTTLQAYGRTLQWWRMPSTSRAYPLKLDKKAEYYARLFS